MDLRLVIGFFAALFLSGCSLTSSLTDLASDKSLLKIDSSATPSHVNTGNLGSFPLAGQCPEGATQVVLTSPINATFPCVNGQFSGTIDLSAVPEGDSDFTLVPDSGTTKTWKIKKDTAAPSLALDPPSSFINSNTVSSFSVSGTCNEEGRFVYVESGSLQFPILCSSGSFYGNLNLWSLPEGAVNLVAKLRDEAGNETTDSESSTKDTLAPSLSLTSAASNPFNATSIVVTATFSESVTGFALGDINVTNGIASGLSGSGATYNFTVTPSGQGAVVVAVAADVAQDSAGNGNTAATNLSRTYDSLAPNLTGLSNDATWTTSKVWSWGCDESCTYRFVVDTTSNTTPSGVFSSVATATQSSGSGSYYLHVEAQDAAGNTTLSHFSAQLDNTVPVAPSGVNDQLYTSSLTQTPVTTFVAGSDVHSGINKYQARVVRTSDSQEMSTWADFTSGGTISGLSLATNTVYRVEVKSIDNVGLESAAAQSDGWIADATAPTAPTGLSVGSVPYSVSSSPALSWTASTDTGGSGVAYYEARVFRASDDAVMSSWTTLASGGSITGMSLTEGTQYYFKVRAYDNVGNVSSESSNSSSWTANNTFTFNATISANTFDYNVRAQAVLAGWDQVTPLAATITVNSSIVVGSTSTSSPGFDTGTPFPVGSTINLINNGFIQGAGGLGGKGRGAGSYNWVLGTAGGDGGPALRAQYAISITNNGTIAGGGGGGGGSGSNNPGVSNGFGSGGGGGAGATPGVGQTNSTGGYAGSSPAGATGTRTTGGAGANAPDGGPGGNGGDWGQPGSAGASGNTWGGYPGGAAGHYTLGNANVTWTVPGTRLGQVSP